MTKKIFYKNDRSMVRLECSAAYSERCFEIAEHVEEIRDKSYVADYVRGSALQLSWNVACSFAETYSNKMLDDVCDLLREKGFFNNNEGISEACMEDRFRRTLLGVE